MTLNENGLTYLADHLQMVVKRIVEARQINLAAIGIGPQFHDFYPVSSQIDAPDDLCVALISLLERVFISKKRRPRRRGFDRYPSRLRRPCRHDPDRRRQQHRIALGERRQRLTDRMGGGVAEISGWPSSARLTGPISSAPCTAPSRPRPIAASSDSGHASIPTPVKPASPRMRRTRASEANANGPGLPAPAAAVLARACRRLAVAP